MHYEIGEWYVIKDEYTSPRADAPPRLILVIGRKPCGPCDTKTCEGRLEVLGGDYLVCGYAYSRPIYKPLEDKEEIWQ
jgi:hypothetical protein